MKVQAMATNMLRNCSHIIDIENAACAVAADREREMAAIQADAAAEGGTDFVNKTIASGIMAGAVAINSNTPVVTNFACGETDALRLVPLKQVGNVLYAACAAGEVALADALLDEDSDRGATARIVAVRDYYPLWIAAYNGRRGVMERLLDMEGVDVNQGEDESGSTPLYSASQQGHSRAVELLLSHPAIDVNVAETDTGTTPLIMASQQDHHEVVKLLLGTQQLT